MEQQVDYIIVGQGICGTFLSYYLDKPGKKILVIDANQPHTSTKVASGVINPVTGRRIVRTWMIEEVMPFAVEAYTQLGRETDKQLVRQCNILDFHPTAQMQLAFDERLPTEDYLRIPESADYWRTYFNYPFAIGETNPCWLIDLHSLLDGWCNRLRERNCLLEQQFDHKQLVLEKSKVRYQNITAEKIFFCDGAGGATNPFFHLLPFALNKGEAILAKIPGLPNSNIFKQGLSIVPWKDDRFWIGSTYEWNFADANPSEGFRTKVETQLRQWLKLPFEIVDHWASVRPANIERRPFVGLHPVHHTIGILNGMGTKGCSLAPFFAYQLSHHIIHGSPIHPNADVKRFSGILSK
ncbi:MAG: FAD-binding oxidoreductase [Bacteroidota bacterium]|nr:FAD-binding oxidoreductase [Bacteroidota bacterium]